ncbi:thiazolylpeptide-type bacteriocin [Kitasatospora sp. NPDC056783]|uniref:thiazolylpeptide-type bacteriocin n=1 Tax=Kitasatospora sp. NPDC056783 TaxID=3345943 RepID=UPI00368C5508
MSDTAESVAAEDLDFPDLDLSELTVTSLRDTVALPEGGASDDSCSCRGSSSCAHPPTPTQSLATD